MSEIKSYVNGLEIFHSGQAHLRSGDAVKVNFSTGVVEIHLFIDKKIQEDKIEWQVEDGTLKVSLINFINPTGSGILHPWNIGSHKGRELFFTVVIMYMDDGDVQYFVCNYIFYLGKEVNIE